jgi:serine/threonine protein phosphatase PrpC
MPLQKYSLGRLLAEKRRGASHQRHNKPCQDAYSYKMLPDSPCLALAIADGHGDAQHDLSKQGAQIAVQIAVQTSLELAKNFHHNPKLLKRIFKNDLPRAVGREWRKKVLMDAKRNLPPRQVKDTSRLIKRYGTTLIVALILPKELLLGQIGDGDILRIDGHGNVTLPFPKDRELIDNETNSLCSPDADKLWQTAMLERLPGEALLLATDGLSNAFANDMQFHTFARSLRDRIQQFGWEAVNTALPGWLDHYSAIGSGDDITLLIFQ